MKTKTISIAVAIMVCFLLVAPALAQPTCEARGKVVDSAGEPVAGAKVIFAPKGNPSTKYPGKTSKKGTFYVPGMFNPSNEGLWLVEVEAEGYQPVQLVLESRNAQRILIGAVTTMKIKPDEEVEVMIRPFGSAQIDITLHTPEEIAASRQGQAATATAEGGQAVAPAQPRADAWDTALGQVSAGDLEGAVANFEKAIEDEPEDAERYGAFAKVLYQMERLDEAEPYAVKAVELAPANVDSLMVLYSIRIGKNDLEGAEQTLVQAREVAPDDPMLLRQMAYVASKTGDTARAIEVYESLVEVAPDDTEAWMNLADLYAETGALDKSEEAYQKVVAMDPKGAHQVFFNIGALIMNDPNRSQEETEQAIKAFRKAIELNPEYVEAHKQLAFALLGSGDRAGAKSELEAYVRLAPEAPDSAQMKAMIQSLQ